MMTIFEKNIIDSLEVIHFIEYIKLILIILSSERLSKKKFLGQLMVLQKLF